MAYRASKSQLISVPSSWYEKAELRLVHEFPYERDCNHRRDGRQIIKRAEKGFETDCFRMQGTGERKPDQHARRPPRLRAYSNVLAIARQKRLLLSAMRQLARPLKRYCPFRGFHW